MRSPTAKVTKFVDDVAVNCHGTVERLSTMAPRVAESFLNALEELGMEPSLDTHGGEGKTVAIASHNTFARDLKHSSESWGSTAKAASRTFGVEFEAPAAAEVLPRGARGLRMKARSARLTAAAHNARKVVRAGRHPALAFGVKCVGLLKPVSARPRQRTFRVRRSERTDRSAGCALFEAAPVAMGSGLLGQNRRLEHSQARLGIPDASFHSPGGRARGEGTEAGFEDGPAHRRAGSSCLLWSAQA